MIEIKHLVKKYDGVVAVDDLSLAIGEGEILALLGPNGSGKTTTLKAIAGLTIPTSGQIVINGIDVREQPKAARQFISFLPQRVAFHDQLLAREVLEFYARLRDVPSSRIDEFLARSGLNFNGFAEKRIGELSGGMIQRLGLAVACLPNAPYLILDEPTLSLDLEGVVRFRDLMRRLRDEGTTIVFATHVFSEVQHLADRVAIMMNGRLVALTSGAEEISLEDLYLARAGERHDA